MTTFLLEDGKELFRHICECMKDGKLIVNDLGTSGEQKESATIHLPQELYFNGAVGAVQYYGGKKAIAEGCIRAIELRFYFEALEILGMRRELDQIKACRVHDRDEYLAFQFENADRGHFTFVKSIGNTISDHLLKRYGPIYSQLKITEVAPRLWELPRL